MEGFLEQIKKAKIGTIIPLIRVIENPINPVEFFTKISNYGRKKHSLLFESSEIKEKYGELSLGTASPCLKIAGFKENFEIIRLRCNVQFKDKIGWTEAYDAIVDTGAYCSLIPLSIWENLKVEKIADYKIKGIQTKEECAIPVIIGKISCIIIDSEGNETSERNLYAFLALVDNVPLILGFKDLLSKFKMVFDFRTKEAYIEE